MRYQRIGVKAYYTEKNVCPDLWHQRKKSQLILARTKLLWTPDVKSVDKLTTLTTTYLLRQPDHPLFIANTIMMDNTITRVNTISRLKSPKCLHSCQCGINALVQRLIIQRNTCVQISGTN